MYVYFYFNSVLINVQRSKVPFLLIFLLYFLHFQSGNLPDPILLPIYLSLEHAQVYNAPDHPHLGPNVLYYVFKCNTSTVNTEKNVLITVHFRRQTFNRCFGQKDRITQLTSI